MHHESCQVSRLHTSKFPTPPQICTDIAARGLDIPSVDTVIHYQLPPTREAYIHRSGRTARADNPGLSIATVGAKVRVPFMVLCPCRDVEVVHYQLGYYQLGSSTSYL